MPALHGRRALVTGASSGIGEATARALAADGATVACLARRSELVAELAKDIGGAPVTCDVADPDAAAAGVAEAVDALGGLDLLVNNAGMLRLGTVADGDVADWRAMLDVNVLGLLAVTQAAIPHLRAAEAGDVVLMSSLAGRRVPGKTTTVYSATKHAVHAIATGLRRELHDSGVRVTLVAPGLVATDLITEQAAADEIADRFQDRLHSTGVGPQDVARAVATAVAEPAWVTTVEIALAPTAQEL